MNSEAPITLRQIMNALRGEIAWMRVYLNRQSREYTSHMNEPEIREAVEAYGDRRVWKVYPGYMFVFFYLE